MRPLISPDPRSPDRTAVSAEKKLALTLYFLKDTGSIRMTANAFGVAKSTVSIIVHDVCQAITSYLGPKYIRLPRTVDEMRELIVKFESRHGFPQAFGCVDETHYHPTLPSNTLPSNSHWKNRMITSPINEVYLERTGYL